MHPFTHPILLTSSLGDKRELTSLVSIQVSAFVEES